MTSDHQDRNGIPLPTGPLEDAAGGEVVDLHPATGRARRPAPPAAELAISSYGEVVARVAAAGEPRWLIQGRWPADAYGVLAAQEKAGKTWAALDLAVSVATGQPWLDHFACPTPGPVLVFLGEGGERATVRRIEAIATARCWMGLKGHFGTVMSGSGRLDRQKRSTVGAWSTTSACCEGFRGPGSLHLSLPWAAGPAARPRPARSLSET